MQVAIDVGGTFTDAVSYRDGLGWRIGKVPTTPEDLSHGFTAGLQAVAEAREVDRLVHGTTVVINAILTGRYPASGLVTTRGFRDVLEIMRADRKDLFDISQAKPAPLIPRDQRFELDERMGADGVPVKEPDPSEIDDLISRIKASGVESVAICFLFSFVNSEHERLVGAAIRERLPGVEVSLSHEVLPVYREFERTSTTTVNALARPLMDRYLAEAEQNLARTGFTGHFLIMQSNGGVASLVEARDRPVTTLFSGPAGGVVAAEHFGRLAGFDKVMGLDMGGTSCDVSAVASGEPERVDYFEVAGYPVSVSSIDIVTVGAGGGSIASVDPGGALQVGPDSAGADPGPACYRRGGELPTVTDASVVLGRYDAEIALGGNMSIDPELARASVGGLADRLDMSVEEAAHGIIRLVNVNMANALREISLERGRDPRDYALVAAGGAGAAHVVEVAGELGIGKVLIPPYPGAASAQGMLLADMRREAVRTFYGPLSRLDPGAIEEALRELSTLTAEALVRDEGAVDGSQVELLTGIDLRYAGQTYEITIPLDPATVSIDSLSDSFHRAHSARYGHSFVGHDVEVVNVRAAAVIRLDAAFPEPPTWKRSPRREKPIHWGGETGLVDTPIVSRAEVQAGSGLTVGPLIIEQEDATTIVPPGVAVRPVEGGSLELDLSGWSIVDGRVAEVAQGVR